MANEILQKQGTSVTWKPSGSGGTRNLTLTSLATVSGRKGGNHDFATGSVFCARVVVELLTKFASGPASGTVDIYWSSSRDNTNYDGGITGTDTAQTDLDINKQLHYVGSLIADNTTNAQQQSWLFVLPGRYGFPVVYNATPQSLSATAGDHILTVTPLIDEIQ